MVEAKPGRSLYFFPDAQVSDDELRSLLAGDDHPRKLWAVSHLLRYAEWDDIWTYVGRDEVRELFPELELPESLRRAWARLLQLEAPVG